MAERNPAGRFASRGLLARRRAAEGQAGQTGRAGQAAPEGPYSRPAPPQLAGRAPRLPASPLPACLLPLPPGFELSPAAAVRPADSGHEQFAERYAG